jgi:hypothetical protein
MLDDRMRLASGAVAQKAVERKVYASTFWINRRISSPTAIITLHIPDPRLLQRVRKHRHKAEVTIVVDRLGDGEDAGRKP